MIEFGKEHRLMFVKASTQTDVAQRPFSRKRRPWRRIPPATSPLAKFAGRPAFKAETDGISSDYPGGRACKRASINLRSAGWTWARKRSEVSASSETEPQDSAAFALRCETLVRASH